MSRAHRRFGFPHVVILVCTLSAGCSAAEAPPLHPFEGTWSGSIAFTPVLLSPYSPTAGTMSMRVEQDGRFTGSVRLANGEASPGLSGRIEPSGVLAGELDQFQLHGSLQRTSASRAQGSAAQLLQGRHLGIVAVDLTRE